MQQQPTANAQLQQQAPTQQQQQLLLQQQQQAQLQAAHQQLLSQQPTSTVHTLPSIQQQQLLEQYDELLKQISLIRSKVSDFLNSFIEEAKTQQSIVNKEEMQNKLKKSMDLLLESIGSIDKVSKKISSYSFQISSSNFSTQEASWAYSTGIYDNRNIKAQSDLRIENNWRSQTSYKSLIASRDLESKLKDLFPIIFQEEEESQSSTLSKKRKQIGNTANNVVGQLQSPTTSATTPSPIFKLPSTPTLQLPSTPSVFYDYFANIERVIHSIRQESALEIFEIQKQSSGAPKGLFVECPDVFKCLICFGIPNDRKDCFTIDRISFFGVKENFDSLWASSKYNIFKKISENSFEAISHYSANHSIHGTILKSVLSWIWSFRGLFLEECKGCSDILHLDSQYQHLPPSFRTFDTFTPYHPSCYQNHLLSISSTSSNTITK